MSERPGQLLHQRQRLTYCIYGSEYESIQVSLIAKQSLREVGLKGAPATTIVQDELVFLGADAMTCVVRFYYRAFLLLGMVPAGVTSCNKA
jgi:hypothetical protein